MNLDEIKRRKDKESDLRTKLREEAKKEVAERKKKQMEKAKQNKLNKPKGADAKRAAAPKNANKQNKMKGQGSR